jgi:hypothetical protein
MQAKNSFDVRVGKELGFKKKDLAKTDTGLL